MFKVRYLTDAWHTVARTFDSRLDAEQEAAHYLEFGFVRRAVVVRA